MPEMQRNRITTGVRIDRSEVKNDLTALINDTENKTQKHTLRSALSLIRQMEGDLRRQGFIEYNDKEEDQ
jgi:hypothetical protein